MMTVMGAISLAGGAIGLLDQGEDVDGRPPIMFLHGVGSDKSVWAPQIGHFSQRRRAVALDYPGYGDSAARPDDGHDGFAAAAIEALDALGIGRAHVCGLSLGGVVAIALHHRAPERLASLILADSFAVHPDGAAIHQRSVESSRSIGMRALAEARVPALVGAEASEALKAGLIETMAAIDPAAYRVGAAAVWLADQRDRAAAIGCPTLVMVGDQDRITPPALSEQLAALVPGSRLEQVAGAGHLANIEQPGAFNRIVDRFLSEVEAKS